MGKTSAKLSKKAFREHINPITTNPLNAIIELIANSYDAGSKELNITWPLNNTLMEIHESKKAIFEDDGCGMSHDDFLKIWGELSYDRYKKQGTQITVIHDNEEIIRETYGKNGKGRHAPFAFCEKYEVETIKNNKLSQFKICMDELGFIIEDSDPIFTSKNNGTKITFNIDLERNIGIEEIRESIATRFLKDELFNIILNGEKIKLTDINDSNIQKITCKHDNDIIEILQLESSNKSNYKKFHGLNWKIGHRLIHDKSLENLMDGRKVFSKKFNYIINANILKDYTNENMTSFIDDSYVNEVKETVYNCINKLINKNLKKENDYNKKSILIDNLSDVKKLSRMSNEEIGTFITKVQKNCPNIKYKDLKAIGEILIKLSNLQVDMGYYTNYLKFPLMITIN